MKKLILSFAIIIFLLACKKENTNPSNSTTIIHDTIQKTNTVTVNHQDTVYCIPKSDLVQGTWYCYYGGSAISPSQIVNFYSNHFVWNGSSSLNNVTYSSDYLTVYTQGNAAYTVKIRNCNELLLLDALQTPYYLRRNQ